MNGYLTYITAEGVQAGIVEIVSCGPDSDAIRIHGRVLADGTGRHGVGGQIVLDARWGGIWLPGVNKCLATG